MTKLETDMRVSNTEGCDITMKPSAGHNCSMQSFSTGTVQLPAQKADCTDVGMGKVENRISSSETWVCNERAKMMGARVAHVFPLVGLCSV